MEWTEHMRDRPISNPIFIALVVIVVWTVLVYNGSDKTPATAEDYLQLEKQISMVEQNPKSFLENEGEYTITEDGKLVAVFSNEECKITAEYEIDETGNLKVISTKKEDKSTPAIVVFIFALVTGILVGGVIFWLLDIM